MKELEEEREGARKERRQEKQQKDETRYNNDTKRITGVGDGVRVKKRGGRREGVRCVLSQTRGGV